MVDALSLLAIALLIGGVIGTVVPLVPGGSLSLVGLFLYWWGSGFTEPGPLALVVLTFLGVLAILAEFLGGAIAARAGGASWKTTAASAVVGILLMIVTGPLGLLVGLFGTVFVLEIVQGGTLDRSVRSAAYATAGILASTAIQVLLTASILFGFVIAVALF
ncbi:hypothetical protein HALLA_13950 [Halostagnicola larsenii XH-48]|uniref:DUF456 domain-containing protein n=1 Tax=Halostagnicola larsenii XH-48 TaxID=797299 RepID=W0JRC2_9EURY|nr:DUF456 domain-containing protein [Halostagnicola larsenii]AHF99724.1 hypothetical protein HALLA_13950 [Halostagnicola larsenii XH-48]